MCRKPYKGQCRRVLPLCFYLFDAFLWIITNNKIITFAALVDSLLWREP